MSRKTRDNVRQHGVLADLFSVTSKTATTWARQPYGWHAPTCSSKKIYYYSFNPFPKGAIGI